MSLYIASINSGSNGNCYYIGNNREAVLIDAGISCRETEKRMRRMGLKMDTVKAIFITHEHGDHIKGLEGIVTRHKLPVYITNPTLHHTTLRVDPALIKSFTAYEAVFIGGLAVLPFPKLHDATDPHSFLVSGNGVTVGVFTDIGAPCQHVTDNFRKCHAAFLEANYDEHMLEIGSYPAHLKKRISSDHGHLSNRQAIELFLEHGPAYMSHLFLSHLSKENNRPDLAQKVFERHAGKTNIVVASRDVESEVYHIRNTSFKEPIQKSAPLKSVQGNLFG